MDMISMILTGLGLSSSAGLNAYLPMVLLGAAQQSGVVGLEGQFPETITSPPAIAIFTILMLIEMTVDKVPGVDSLNDIVSTLIRPAAGTALMYATTTGVESSIDPEVLLVLSLVAGGASAGGVHATKAVTRPAVTVSTGGIGNFFVSIIEDVIALIVSIFALVIPLIVVVFLASFIVILPWWIWEQQRIDGLRQRGLIR